MAKFLLEIGSEQIPAFYLKPAYRSFENHIRKFFTTLGIKEDLIKIKGAYSPRRITIFVEGFPTEIFIPGRQIKGPLKDKCFDKDGRPTKALEGFLKKYNKKIEKVIWKSEKKGEYAYIYEEEKRLNVFSILSQEFPSIILKIHFPKTMFWGNKSFRYTRPIRWLLSVAEGGELSFTYANIKSGPITYGHQFLTKNKSISISKCDFEEYVSVLRDNYVYVLYEERESIISKKIHQILPSECKILHTNLIEEVANMVEYPEAILGEFDHAYLEIPDVVVIAAMTEHQRYFPVYKNLGELTNYFVCIADRKKDTLSIIKEGNERVLTARLADARFFWEQDRKKDLDQLNKKLKDVVFDKITGSVYNKIERVRKSSKELIKRFELGPREEKRLDFCSKYYKADLCTDLVYEFPSLEGKIIPFLIREKGYPPEYINTISQSFKPRTSTDTIPQDKVAQIISLVDSIDTIIAGFLGGNKPTGSGDPWGLRRKAIGVLRILIEGEIDISIEELINISKDSYTSLKVSEEIFRELIIFFRERLRNLFIEKGIRYDLVDSILKTFYKFPLKAYKILKFFDSIKDTELFLRTIRIVERLSNITKSKTLKGEINIQLFCEEEEKRLWFTYIQVKERFEELIKKEEFRGAVELFTESFHDVVHAFFEKVFVNVEDEKIRENRLLLLGTIRDLFIENLGDISEVVIK